MLGELYLQAEMPEPPKESFFKGLWALGGGAKNVDREELCKSKMKTSLLSLENGKFLNFLFPTPLDGISSS